jgi:hypothetical protein
MLRGTRLQILLILLVIAAVLATLWLAWKAEQKRRAAFAAWAVARGFTYAHKSDPAVRAIYGFLNRLQVGHSRKGYHVLRGEWQGRPAAAFEFQYTVGSGKHQQIHHVGVALLHLELVFPELLIGPENVLHRLGEFFGFDDIDFESIEFSRAFQVRCRDKKFAYDFCHTGMMEYLLAHRDACFEQENGVLALLTDGSLKAERLDGMFQSLHAVRSKMPEYLFQT